MSTSSLDDLISRVIREAETAAEQQRQGGPSTAELGVGHPVAGHGSALDDRIRATVTDGRLTELELQPQAMRLTNADLSEHVVQAVNEALAGYQSALMTALTDQQPDLSSVADGLREIQADAVRAVSAYTDQMYEVLKRVQDR